MDGVYEMLQRIYLTGIVSVQLTRRGENESPILVNWSKFSTLEPIVEYKEAERGFDEQTPETVGSTIVLDSGIAIEVMQTPEEIDEILRYAYILQRCKEAPRRIKHPEEEK